MILFLLLLTAGLAPKDDPEVTVRALVKAIYSNDRAAYEQVTLPDPRRARLTSGGRVNAEKLKQLEEDPEGLQIIQKQPFRYQGKDATPDASGAYPMGTTVRYMVAHYGNPMMVTLVKRADGWKVDLRWWLAMLELSDSSGPKPGTPEYAARMLMASLAALDRAKAAQFVMTPEQNMDFLFAGAPSQREPSGQIDALVMEMPLVEIGPGEFCEMPTGQIVEGVTQDDRKVLVGILGPIEIPFIVRRVGTEWRVAAQPYFTLLMQ